MFSPAFSMGEAGETSPQEVICIFRCKTATHSDLIRPPIPIEIVHLFRLIPATFRQLVGIGGPHGSWRYFGPSGA